MTLTIKKATVFALACLVALSIVVVSLLLARSGVSTDELSSNRRRSTDGADTRQGLPSQGSPDTTEPRAVSDIRHPVDAGAPAAAGNRRAQETTPFERSLAEYNALVAELDADLAAYRASTPLFSRFSDVYVKQICPVVVRGVQAGLWLGEARKRGMRPSNYDKQKARKAYTNILAAIYKDVYPEFEKAIKAGRFAFSSEQGRLNFRTCQVLFQTSDSSLSGPFEQHYPYQDKKTPEYWRFAESLMMVGLTAAAPLRKMVEQIPSELKEKQDKVKALHDALRRQAAQSRRTVALPLAYREPYLKRLEDEEARFSLPEELAREAREAVRQLTDETVRTLPDTSDEQ